MDEIAVAGRRGLALPVDLAHAEQVTDAVTRTLRPLVGPRFGGDHAVALGATIGLDRKAVRPFVVLLTSCSFPYGDCLVDRIEQVGGV
jgi:arginase family enzyme